MGYSFSGEATCIKLTSVAGPLAGKPVNVVVRPLAVQVIGLDRGQIHGKLEVGLAGVYDHARRGDQGNLVELGAVDPGDVWM